MLFVITHDQILINDILIRANGTAINTSTKTHIRSDQASGEFIMSPSFSLKSDNIFASKTSPLIKALSMPVRSIIVVKDGIVEVNNQDSEVDIGTFIPMESHKGWFYVRGDLEDSQVEKFFTVGLLLGKTLKEVVDVADKWLPAFNKQMYTISDRSIYLDKLSGKIDELTTVE